MVKPKATAAGSDIFRSCAADDFLDGSGRKKHTPSGCESVSGRESFWESLHSRRAETEISGRVDGVSELLEVRTRVGNLVENTGFSTALNMVGRSTIWFGHASAACDPNPNKERNFVT